MYVENILQILANISRYTFRRLMFQIFEALKLKSIST